MRAFLVSCMMIALAGCQKPQEQHPPSNENASAEAGVPTKGIDRSHKGSAMPDAQIFNADDDQSTLAEAKGKPVLVNLWASWCAPCVKELPTLDALSRTKGAPRILAVSEDVGERPSVEAFLDQHGIKDVEAWRDPEMALTSALEVQVMPTTVYYDAEGREVWRYVGDLDWAGEEAAKLLAEAAPVGGR